MLHLSYLFKSGYYYQDLLSYLTRLACAHVNKSRRYFGDWPCRRLKVKNRILKSIRCCTGSQFRSLKLPSLFIAWLLWTFHTESHNMKSLVILILNHSWPPFLPLTCLYGKKELCRSLCGILKYFLEKKLLSDYPGKSHDHDHPPVGSFSHGLITVRQKKMWT